MPRTRPLPFDNPLRPALAALIALLALAQGVRAAEDCDDLSGQPLAFAVDWQADVKPILTNMLGANCTGCHNAMSPTGGLDLSDTTEDAVYKLLRGGYLVPGDGRASELFVKVNCAIPDGGSRMPLAGLALDPADQGLVFDWIEQGAYATAPPPATAVPERDFLFRDGAESVRGPTTPP